MNTQAAKAALRKAGVDFTNAYPANGHTSGLWCHPDAIIKASSVGVTLTPEKSSLFRWDACGNATNEKSDSVLVWLN